MTTSFNIVSPGKAKSSPKKWHGCYDESWKGEISDESFAHPAKFSRALIRRIYEYALAEGYIQPGDTILDPFGGIGLGAIDSLANELNWLGLELEPKFVDLGAGCDCTGISKADWIRFYGRWARVNHKDGRHWCPRCLAQAGEITEPSPQLGFFEAAPSASYIRNSGQIPTTQPHRYNGNLDRFRRYAQGGAQAVLLQGDSRKLVEIIRGEMAATRSSPPFGQAVACQDPNYETGRQNGGGPLYGDYGDSPGQLGSMPEGDPSAVISSPPYINTAVEKSSSGVDLRKNYETYKASGGGMDFEGYCRIQAKHSQGYGQADGQMAAMPEGDPAAVITSPPFAGNSGGRGEASRQGIDAALFDRHSGGMIGGMGDEPGNLGNLPQGQIQAAMKSPPFEQHGAQSQGGQQRGGGKFLQTEPGDKYDMSEGQLAKLPPGDLAAVISSPPFAGSVGSDDPEKRGGILVSDPKRAGDRNLTGSYGNTPGQLGAMSVEAAMKSPPYEHNRVHDNGIDHGKLVKYRPGPNSQATSMDDYGHTAGQVGKESGETFWQAARLIVEQCHQVLAEDAVSIWVTKRFVRNGEIVEFSHMWRSLCESVGFEHVETIRAMLVKSNGKQVSLGGEVVEKTVERKSFFRRLAEQKGSPRIDWEDVIIMRKRSCTT